MILSIIASIVPLILYSLLGVVFARACRLEQKHADAVMLLVFYIFMPANLFLTAYNATVDMQGLLRVVVVACVVTILECVLSSLIAMRIAKETATVAAVASVMWKGNYTMLGLPVAAALLNDDGYVVFALIAVVLSILSNLIVIPQLSYHMRLKSKSGFGAVIQSVCKNPAVLGAIAGFIARPLLPDIPSVVMNPLISLSACSGVISLIMIGISIGVNGLGKSNRLMMVTGFGKLVLMPLLCYVFGILCGIRGEALGAMVLCVAMPPGIIAGALARGYKADDAFANEAVFSLTAFSAVTLFLIGLLIRLSPV